MPPCQQFPEGSLPGLESDPKLQDHDASIQDADARDTAAEFNNIPAMIESLDELLAGESELPATKYEPYDDQLSVLAYPTPELDPATVVWDSLRLKL